MKDERIPRNRFRYSSAGMSDCQSSYSSKKPLAKIAGKPNKKENLAASSLFNPIINPPMIVEPEREHPGIKARA